MISPANEDEYTGATPELHIRENNMRRFLENRLAQLQYEAEFGRPDTLWNRFLDWCEITPNWIHLNYGSILVLATLIGLGITIEIVSRIRTGEGAFF